MIGSRSEINGILVMVQGTLRLDFLSCGSSCQMRSIKLILLKYPSSLREALGVVMPLLPHLTSPTSVTLGASHP
ncbi:hypothetical protein AAG906_027271 [Vitis piasezkii]